jgi:uncharacterized protein YdeI (YjbR/CyaY-like superfamily)
MMSPLFFSDREQWRSWLERNHSSEKEVWLLFHKKRTGKSGLNLNEAVEEAICYGWIDSILRRVDDEKHMLRFSPRKKNSKWAVSNLERAQNMIRQGKMTEAGLRLLPMINDKTDPRRYPPEVEDATIPEDLDRALHGNPPAYDVFKSLARSHRRRYIYWITQAKRLGTREKRIRKVLESMTGEKDSF